MTDKHKQRAGRMKKPKPRKKSVPLKRAREWWVTTHNGESWGVYETKRAAHQLRWSDGEIVCVREVLTPRKKGKRRER